MNRSILIVICDFLVSSMLSMMTGMVPANSSGNGIGLDANSTRVLIVELERSRSELLQLRNALRANIERTGMTQENQAKMDELNKKLAQNELEIEKLQTLKDTTPENTGILSREELEKRLEAEKLRRIEAEIREQEKNESITMVRDMLKETQSALQQARESEANLRYEVKQATSSLNEITRDNDQKIKDLARTQERLSQTEKALADSRQNLTQTQTALAETRTQNTRLETELNASQKSAAASQAEAEKSKTELTKTQTTLAYTQQQLQETQGQVQLTLRRNTQSEEELNRLRGQNAATTRELAEMKDKAGKLERELEQQKVLRREAETARSNAESFSKATTLELAEKGAAARKAEAALAATQKKLVEAEAEKKAVQQELQFLQKQTGTDLFAHYQKSVVRLGIEIMEERLVKDFGGNSVHYLPIVKIGQKNYLIGALPMFAGGEDKPYHYQKVKKLAFVLAGKNLQMALNTPLLVSQKEPYLAAFKLPALPGITPLQSVQADKLRQRGVQKLTLFKTTSCGKDSMPLGDRCSLDLQPGAPALIIRNNARNATEIKAQIGDFVLTNDGEFVGVVVSVSDAGRYQEARVALCDDATWQNADQVSLEIDVTDKYYHQFGDYMKNHIKR